MLPPVRAMLPAHIRLFRYAYQRFYGFGQFFVGGIYRIYHIIVLRMCAVHVQRNPIRPYTRSHRPEGVFELPVFLFRNVSPGGEVNTQLITRVPLQRLSRFEDECSLPVKSPASFRFRGDLYLLFPLPGFSGRNRFS